MGFKKHQSAKSSRRPAASAPDSRGNINAPEEPQLVRRRANRNSTIRSGRTIGVEREHLETASQRQQSHAKKKRAKRARILIFSLVLVLVAICISVFYFLFIEKPDDAPLVASSTPTETFTPTIEIVDEDGNQIPTSNTSTDNSDAATSGITARMRAYIGQAEADFRDLGYQPIKAVLPTGSIREVDFYLNGYPGFVKMLIDRDTAPSVEDADRLLRYLKEQGITDFKYIDVRLPSKAYWQ